MGNVAVVGPNQAVIVSGGVLDRNKKKKSIGGWLWVCWGVTDKQYLSLNVMTLFPYCESVETVRGVPLNVNGVAQVKIMKEHEFLEIAAEQFLGKSEGEIKSAVQQTVEGHLRAILGTLTVEEAYKDREKFAAKVRKVAAPDLAGMGIQILSFTIRDIFDNVQYLSSLGKARIAEVKRDALIGVAQADRDAGIREAECEKATMDVKYQTDTKIENNSRMYQLQKANFDQEVNTAKAEAQLAYDLQAAKIHQMITKEEIQIDVVERRKQIEIEEKEVERKERELNVMVRLPAEAESYQVQTIAEGERTSVVQAAKADGERIRLTGTAEAIAIKSVGKADAERMRVMAQQYKKYGGAAIMDIVLHALPKIAAEVSAPLAKTEEIVLLGGSGVGRLVSPPSVQPLTGVDLSRALGKVPGVK